jgi:hypothetical protein
MTIHLTLRENIIQKENNPVLIKEVHRLGKFRQSSKEKINLMVQFGNEEQLDREIEKFLVDIQQSAWENTPEIKRRTKGNNYHKAIRDLIAEKRKARQETSKTKLN